MRTKRFGRTCRRKRRRNSSTSSVSVRDLTPVPIVLPPKRDGVVGDGDEPVIGDGDAVGVAREVVQHVGGTAKGRLGVDHPRLAIERSEQRAKGRRPAASGCKAPGKCEATLRETPSRRPATSFPRKTCRSTVTGRKKRRPRVDPPRAVGRQAARGHDAVDVRMMLEALPPRVEDHQPANRRRPGASDSRATWSSVAAAARNRRSYTTRLLTSARRASGSGIVKTRWT